MASTFLRTRLPSRTCISQLHTRPCIPTSGPWLVCSRCLESTRSLMSLRICLIAPAPNYALVECSPLILYLMCHLVLEDLLATIAAHGFCTAVLWLSPASCQPLFLAFVTLSRPLFYFSSCVMGWDCAHIPSSNRLMQTWVLQGDLTGTEAIHGLSPFWVKPFFGPSSAPHRRPWKRPLHCSPQTFLCATG